MEDRADCVWSGEWPDRRRPMKRKCDKCDRPATMHLTDIVDGNKIERHLCEVCAANEGITVTAHVPIQQLLEEFVTHSQKARQLGELVCDQCHTSFLEFRQSGLLGCPHDYEVFAEALTPLLARAHEGGSQHVGKVPSRAGGDQQLQVRLLRLRSALGEAVQREDYRQAARIRDQIKELEES